MAGYGTHAASSNNTNYFVHALADYILGPEEGKPQISAGFNGKPPEEGP